MNTLILYASKYGCAKDCATTIKNRLSGNVDVIHIQKQNIEVNLDQYDTIIIGSSIYIGTVPKKLKQFCEDNSSKLIKKNLGIYLCCGSTDKCEEYLLANFPEVFVKAAKSVKAFGGEARLEKMKFMDKLIIKAATKGDYSSLKISPDSIDEFIFQMEGK